MTRTLEAHDKRIYDIFEGTYRFTIPDYQRPYAWTTEQACELFDDVMAALQDKKEKDSPQYFLGSIVLIKKDNDPSSEVVDGQQRLATLTILLAALRLALPSIADEITDFIYKKGRKSLGEPDDFMLRVREEDADFFRRNIQTKEGFEPFVTSAVPLRDSQLRFYENANALLDKVRSLGKDQRSKFFKFLVHNCSLVVITTPNFDSAYRIFSVLNDRGLDLAPIDILKAPILGGIPGDKRAMYAKKWSVIESEIGREAFGELFSHIRTIYAKDKQRGTLVREFQEKVREYKKPCDLIDNVIAPYAEAWACIKDAGFESKTHAEEINECLSWLNRVDFKDWVPPSLVFFKKFQKEPKKLLRFFEKMERLTYFLFVTKAAINERIAIYAKITKEIETASFDGEMKNLASIGLSSKKRSEFIKILDGNIYEELPRARLALLFILERLKTDGSAIVKYSQPSIEHVLPQNPKEDSQWLEWFPDQDEREKWTHRLANLVPLHRRKNSEASNFEFKQKKEAYFFKGNTASPFVITNEIREIQKWDSAVLLKRQRKLVEVLAKHWKLISDNE